MIAGDSMTKQLKRDEDGIAADKEAKTRKQM
jgi:hypothetical protein